jgi:hypothetical protein
MPVNLLLGLPLAGWLSVVAAVPGSGALGRPALRPPLAVDSTPPTAAPPRVDTSWYQPPFEIQVDGVPLDVADRSLGGGAPGDDFGHAAPFLADLDGDGRRDLVVGTFAGRFRFYRNLGTDRDPKFSKEFTWLKGGDEIAQVVNYCCVASGPQLVDIDGDGIVDLSSGSYQPGAVYWWKGLGHGQYATRQMLTDWRGIPIFAHLETLGKRYTDSFMSNIAWGDLYGTGRPDMVLGDADGELFIRKNQGVPVQRADQNMTQGAETAIPSQPVFSEDQIEIRIDGQKAIPEDHAAPAVADWDGDGLLDILVGTDAGSVYLFRNTGTRTKPEFRTRELLVGPGEGVEQWVEPGHVPRRGIRAQIQVVDYNGDGKPDLLVGDWSYTMTPRSTLTAREKQRLQELRTQLAALDKSVGFDYRNWRHKWEPYVKDTTVLHQAEALTKQMGPYLEGYSENAQTPVLGDDPWGHLKAHGHVWVFLNKGTPVRP